MLLKCIHSFGCLLTKIAIVLKHRPRCDAITPLLDNATRRVEKSLDYLDIFVIFRIATPLQIHFISTKMVSQKLFLISMLVLRYWAKLSSRAVR